MPRSKRNWLHLIKGTVISILGKVTSNYAHCRTQGAVNVRKFDLKLQIGHENHKEKFGCEIRIWLPSHIRVGLIHDQANTALIR